jgi:hypothetical protein
MNARTRCLSLLIILFASPHLSARVTHVEITSRADVLDAKSFADAGPYERIAGRVYFSVPAIGAPSQRIAMTGSYLQFPKTAAERKHSGDPRKPVAERYASRDAYLAKFAKATDDLIQQRWILPEDRAALLQRGGEEWDLLAH